MSITIFGIFLVLMVLFFLFRAGNIKKIFSDMFFLTIFVTLNIRMGYFIRIGNSYLNYENFLVYTTFMLSLPLFLRRANLNRKEIGTIICFNAILVLGLMYNILSPYKEGVVTYDWEMYVRRTGNPVSYLDSSSPKIGYYLMLICIISIILIAKKTFTMSDWIALLHKLVTINKVSIVLGFVEFLVANILKTRLITDICIKIASITNLMG